MNLSKNMLLHAAVEGCIATVSVYRVRWSKHVITYQLLLVVLERTNHPPYRYELIQMVNEVVAGIREDPVKESKGTCIVDIVKNLRLSTLSFRLLGQ